MKQLSHSEIEASLKNLVREERRITLEILHHLREIESRKIFALRGFPSLFEYTLALGYGHDSAHRRIQAMRLLKEIPEVETKLTEGVFSVATLCQAQSFFKKEELSKEQKVEFLSSIEGKSKRDVEREIASLRPEDPRPEYERPISATHTEIRFTADESLLKKLKRIQELASHSRVETFQKLFHYMADRVLARLERSVRPGEDSCVHKDPVTGRVCGSRHFVQTDHILPRSLGGTDDPKNLRKLCGVHNRIRPHG